MSHTRCRSAAMGDSELKPGVFCLCDAKQHGATLSWNDARSCARHFCELTLNAQRVLQAQRLRNPAALHDTRMLRALSLGRAVFVKLESEQVTNSFKARGALHCAHHARGRPLVTASTGNHALALLHAAQLHRLHASVFVPHSVTRAKLDALMRAAHGCDCDVRVVGTDCLQAELAAMQFAKQRRAMYVSPYNDELVIAGQGTIAVEIMEYLAKSEPSFAGRQKCCYVTVGGGALIAGVASVLKASQPGQWRIVACLPQNSPVMFESIKAGRVVQCVCKYTLSDGSAGPIDPNAITYEACAHLVDAWAIVSEEDIKSAMVHMLALERKLLEGAAAVAVAALRRDAEWRLANDCVASVVIACGGNVGVDTMRMISGSAP